MIRKLQFYVNICREDERSGEDLNGLILHPKYVEDAIAMLKEMEPRVLTLEEVMSTPKDVAIWQEIKDEPDYKYEISPVAEPMEIIIDDNWDFWTGKKKDTYVGIRFASEGHMPKESYGKDWRCWTSRPTDEQRKAVKWNDQGGGHQNSGPV